MGYISDIRATARRLDRAGVSRIEWAEAAGVDRTTLWRVLRGKLTPSVEVFFAIKNAEGKLLARQSEK